MRRCGSNNKFEAPLMKHEIRNKFKIQIFKIQNKNNLPPEAAVYVLVIWICFEFQASRFRALFKLGTYIFLRGPSRSSRLLSWHFVMTAHQARGEKDRSEEERKRRREEKAGRARGPGH